MGEKNTALASSDIPKPRSLLRLLLQIDVGVLVAVLLCLVLPPVLRVQQQQLLSHGGATKTKAEGVGEEQLVLPSVDLQHFHRPPEQEGEIRRPVGEQSLLRVFEADRSGKAEAQDELTNNPVGRLKVFVYNLPAKYNRNFVNKDRRCLTHMFAAEIFFHSYILHSPVRTLKPEEADWFYAPLYTTCDLTPSGLPLPFRAPRMMRSALAHIAQFYPYWNRTEGADHFFITPHDFAACFHFQEEKAIGRGIMPLLQRATLVQTFGQKNHVCLKEGSIVVPPFAPPQHMRRRILPDDTKRSIFVYFRGLFYDTNNDPEGGYYARGARASVWENFKDNPLFDISAEHPVSYYEDMQRSIFCLCPLGWAPWSPRIVESVVFGCIPVIIADDIVLPFADVIPWKEISVFVPEEDVPYLDQILGAIGPERILEMQKRLSSTAIKRAMLFSQPPLPGDAFNQILNGLARKLPHPPSTYLKPGQKVLNWSSGPAQDFKPWKPDSDVYW